MNVEGYKETRPPKFSSLVDWGAATDFFFGLAKVAQNVRFDFQSVNTRGGLRRTLNNTGRTTGMAEFRYKAGTAASDIPFLLTYSSTGLLQRENPSGSGTSAAITGTNVVLPANSYMQAAQAFDRSYIAFSDLKSGTALPAVFDGLTLNLDPLSMKPFGVFWTATTKFYVGEVISPTPANGHLYRCTTAGTTAANQPAYTGGVGDVIADGSAVFTELTPTFASDAAAGNICTGQRWMVILFQNRNGYITGMTEAVPVGVNLVTAAKKVAVSNIAIGPNGTAARIVAFTTAGSASTAVGPFFYLAQDKTISGVLNTATIIKDNVTTAATFNFTDNFLITGVPVQGQFAVVQAPPCVDIAFLPSIQRLVLTGANNYRSGHLFSGPNDPETINTVTGVVQVAENDGDSTFACREFRGQIFSFKENSAHIITPNQGQPNTWNSTERFRSVGIAGPRAVAISGEQFMILAHRSGIYTYNSGDEPTLLTGEIRNTWARVNWAAKETIWVHIDEDTKHVHIGVPLDNAVIPSHIIVLNYQTGWGWPLSTYKKVLPRKWSIDPISAHSAIRTSNRTLATPPDPSVASSQMLYASAIVNDGIHMYVDNVYDDNGAWIDSQFDMHPAPGGIPGPMFQIAGLQGSASGNGMMTCQLVPVAALNPQKGISNTVLRDVPLQASETPFARGARGSSEGWGVRFTNGADTTMVPAAAGRVPGTFFKLHACSVWLKQQFAARQA
jgi:hypothetical protein